MSPRGVVRIIAATLLIGATADAQVDCDCTRKPYKPDPPCYLKCVSSILFLAKSEELERLGIPAATVQRIGSLRTQAESPSELVASLTREELETVRTSFDEVSDASLRSVALEIWKPEAHQVPEIDLGLAYAAIAREPESEDTVAGADASAGDDEVPPPKR